MSGASTCTYPENLGSGGQLPAELRGRVCLFCFFFVFFVRFFVCPSRYDARHRKPRRCVYSSNLGGTGISTPDNFRYRSSFRSRSRSCSTTSGDIFYCSGSRQLNHSSPSVLLQHLMPFNCTVQCVQFAYRIAAICVLIIVRENVWSKAKICKKSRFFGFSKKT